MINTKSYIYIFTLTFWLSVNSATAVATDNGDINNHPLKDFKVLSDSVPTEMNLMISHLKELPLSEKQIKTFLATSEIINKDMQKIPKPNSMFLLKSESYKGILNTQYFKRAHLLQINQSILENIKVKLQKNEQIYTSFSKWLIKSIIKDFDPFIESNFLNSYQSLRLSNSRKNFDAQLKLKKLNKILKYHSPWIESIEHSTPEEFNQLCTNIIIDTFSRISKRTYFFRTFSGKFNSEKSPLLFNIPKLLKYNGIKAPPSPQQENQNDSSLQQTSKERKEQALKGVEKLDTDDLSELSGEIDKINPK